MTTFFPLGELLDRYCIAVLKFHKTSANLDELNFYKDQILSLDLESVKSDVDALYDVHSKIWTLESELKSGVEHHLSLEEIGRRAIEIRNWNKQRIQIKNKIADLLGDPIREIKKDHLSQ